MKVAIGVGCDRGTPLETIEQALQGALALIQAPQLEVAAVATITLKADERGLLAFAQQRGLTLALYGPDELSCVPVPNPSETVRGYTGTPSVSEAAALLAAGRAGGADAQPSLLVEKFKHRGADGRSATVSVAKCGAD